MVEEIHQRLNTKTVGIAIKHNEIDALASIEDSDVLQYLVNKHENKKMERIILQKNFSFCAIKCESFIRTKINMHGLICSEMSKLLLAMLCWAIAMGNAYFLKHCGMKPQPNHLHGSLGHQMLIKDLLFILN